MAAYSIAAFRARFDFFTTASEPLIQACLDEAEEIYAYAASFPQYRAIIGNHAAHLLATSPGGSSMRVEGSDAPTAYAEERDRLLELIPAGPMVIQ